MEKIKITHLNLPDEIEDEQARLAYEVWREKNPEKRAFYFTFKDVWHIGSVMTRERFNHFGRLMASKGPQSDKAMLTFCQESLVHPVYSRDEYDLVFLPGEIGKLLLFLQVGNGNEVDEFTGEIKNLWTRSGANSGETSTRKDEQ